MFSYYFVDISKYVLAGGVLVFLLFYLIKPYLVQAEKIQLLELRKSVYHQTLALKLQAYERLVLLVERINPVNMLLRFNVKDMSVSELHKAILQEVRNEYQYNLSQQLYVSSRAWQLVKKVKEDTLGLINNMVQTMPVEATATQLSTNLLVHVSALEENPYDVVIAFMKTDLKDLF